MRRGFLYFEGPIPKRNVSSGLRYQIFLREITDDRINASCIVPYLFSYIVKINLVKFDKKILNQTLDK